MILVILGLLWGSSFPTNIQSGCTGRGVLRMLMGAEGQARRVRVYVLEPSDVHHIEIQNVSWKHGQTSK